MESVRSHLISVLPSWSIYPSQQLASSRRASLQFTWKCKALVCAHVGLCVFYILCTSLSFLPQGQSSRTHFGDAIFLRSWHVSTHSRGTDSSARGLVVDRIVVYGNVISQLLGQASTAMPPPSLWTTPSLEPSAKINCFFLKLLLFLAL